MIEDVIDKLVDLSAQLPAGDGVRAFNEMYLETTRQVAEAVRDRKFADPDYLVRLDVVFADLYLSAWRTYQRDPGKVPESWRALFDSRSSRGVQQFQFAIAGMNAHINYDLALALVATTQEFGGSLDSGRQRDYQQIDAILTETAPTVREKLLSGPFALLDRALGDADDRASLWAIGRAREFAWATGQAKWLIRGTVVDQAVDEARDRMVALASQLLLAPRT